MAKSMFDVYQEDVQKIQDIFEKIQEYTILSTTESSKEKPIIFMLEAGEVERLKSLHGENALRLGSLSKTPSTDGRYIKTPIIDELENTLLFDQDMLKNRISEIEFEKQRHLQNMEAIEAEHKNRMELESLRNRRAFDGIAMADLETILASEDTEGIVITKKLSAIAWCHQQAVLIGSNMGVSIETSFGYVFDLESTAKYLFNVFFSNLAQNGE